MGSRYASSEFRVLSQDAELRAGNSERSPVSYTPAHLADLYRLYGELTLQQENQKAKIKSQKAKIESDPHTEAEAYFLKAVEIARRQQAKSLELRAVMSLVRLRQQQATQLGSRTTQHETRTRLDEAHLMLAEIYNWFTEGFDTKDLREAKALIDELNH